MKSFLFVCNTHSSLLFYFIRKFFHIPDSLFSVIYMHFTYRFVDNHGLGYRTRLYNNYSFPDITDRSNFVGMSGYSSRQKFLLDILH